MIDVGSVLGYVQPPQRVAEIGPLGALQTAHAAGILHRDVKPGNTSQDLVTGFLGTFAPAR